jgi:hypothetical protein
MEYLDKILRGPLMFLGKVKEKERLASLEGVFNQL